MTPLLFFCPQQGLKISQRAGFKNGGGGVVSPDYRVSPINAANKVLFLPGWLSDGGRKTACLRSLGYDVRTPRLSDWSFRSAVRSAQDAFDEFQPGVIVGSSRGGAVAMSLGAGQTPLVLLAPAWRWCGVEPVVRSRAVILHSPTDRTIPVTDSRELYHRNPHTRLIEVGHGHRLNDVEAGDGVAGVLDELLPNPRGKCE